VGPDYFETYGTPLLAGRGIRASDDTLQAPVVVVNVTAARLIAPGGNAIGRLLDVTTIRDQHPTIVGIVPDFPQWDVAMPPVPEAFSATKQEVHRPWNLAVRVAGDPEGLALPVQQAVRDLDPELAVQTVTMASLVSSSLAPHQFTAVLLGSFAALAMILAAVGLFGVIAYLVEQRTREIGVRMALGAQQRHVLGLVLREGLTLTAAGLAVGVTLALELAHLLKSLLYEVQPTDAGVIAMAAFVLSVVTVVAAYLPARRALSIEPVEALRAE
jgi:putative ABC transport system permease protein